jgi:asparagine synthase (glutamine-hydrolysing)
MCGITGILAFNLIGNINKINITAATMSLQKRGPDFQDVYFDEFAGLGHRRLSIIDTSSAANQPMWDESKRYSIIFNGEIFNYRELRADLESKGVKFFSHSDTEVLLKLYMREGHAALAKLNGFFAFCIYDKQQQTFFVARDRFGIKPLLYVFDDDKFLFASEMKTILEYGIEKDLDFESLYSYLQLNYIPAPHTIFKSVKKLLPGHFILASRRKLQIDKWYEIPFDSASAGNNPISYDDAKKKFAELLEASVKKRLVSDVPLGSFLSGGIDSSVIAALAKKHKPHLHTFSIGFRDEKFFDETAYANLVAKHIGSEHTVFSLTNDDLYSHVHDILNYIDEPFADSSAINVFILSKETRKHATVALSGDGADELLGGYNKHAAFQRLINKGLKENLAQTFLPLLKTLPQSRNNSFSNKVRQLVRFAEGAKLPSKERYWRWAGYATEDQAMRVLNAASREKMNSSEYDSRKNASVRHVPQHYSINDVLRNDVDFVLPNDMLMKVDLMSMSHGLEIRVPFLDYEVVNFLFTLPGDFKINRNIRKRILQDTFRDILPSELYNRPKKGFEVPMLKWLQKEMRSLIVDDLLSKKFVEDQGIFDLNEIERLKKQLFSSNPGDVHARIWGLVVFQWWWRRYGVTAK